MHLKQKPIHFFVREQMPTADPAVCQDVKGRPPIAVVAICEDLDGNVARGIAILSEHDNFRRSVGRQKAIDKARWALKNKKAGFPIGWAINTDEGDIVRPSAISFMSAWTNRMQVPPPNYKASFNPSLTSFEQHLVEKSRKQQEPA